MNTTIRTIIYAAAVVMASVSCQKSAEPANPAEEGKGTIDICVNGLMGEYTQQDGVKSSLVNNVRVAWAAGDVVYVFDGSKYLGKLTAALDKKAYGQTDEDRYAKLGGTINAPATTPCVLSLVHSSLMTEPKTGAAVSELSIDMSAQSTATVPFVAYAALKYTGTTITDVVVPFQFATSVIKVNCTGLKANTAITSATLSNVNTACKLTLSGAGVQNVSGDVNGIITRTGDEYFAAAKINDEGEAVFQIAVPALEEASQARVMTVAQGSDKVEDKKFTKKALSAATSVNTVCQLVNVLPAGALPGVFTVSPEGKKVHFSQGNLTYDVNASTNKWKFYEHQYDCATGYDPNLISLFTWGYGTWSTSPNGTDYQTGDFTDWGKAFDDKGTWRTLSTAEWQYLFNYGSYQSDIRKNKYKWATVNGVGGYVIAPDGFSGTLADTYADDAALAANNLVFLPAAGIRDGSGVYGVGDGGVCWSSTANDESSAYDVFFNSLNVYPDHGDARDLGCSVRLITEVK